MNREELGYGILTVAETESVIMALLQGQKTATEEEMQIALKWAHETKVFYTVFKLVLEGEVVISLNEKGQVLAKLANGDDFDMDVLNADILV